VPRPYRHPASRLWAIVLAGGQGVRLRPLVRLLYGDDRPKQYASLTGPKSLLVDTLERAALGLPPERTIVVTSRGQERYVSQDLERWPQATLLVQPRDLGTAAGILLPALWALSRDPEALLVVLPSDHLIGDGSLFMDHVLELAPQAERQPRRIILVGAQPTEAETEYGWIEPGDHSRPVGMTSAGPVFPVGRFREKPSPEEARACLEKGALWNTFVMVARASTFSEAGRLALPQLHALLRSAAASAAEPEGADALEHAYRSAERANFSRSVLQTYPSLLAVSRMPSLRWSDLGTPERVFRSLRLMGVNLPWLTTSQALRQRGPRS